MNNKNSKKIITGIIAFFMTAGAYIWGRISGRNEGHKEGVEDANKRNEESLDEIMKKHSQRE